MGFSPLEKRLQVTESVLRNFAIIRVLPFLNNPKDLDPSYKVDLDFLGLFWKGKKLCLTAKDIW